MSLYTIDEFGRAVVDSRGLFELWFQGIDEHGLSINLDADVEAFNHQCAIHGKDDYLIKADEAPPMTHVDRVKQWVIPEEFAAIDVLSWCLDLCASDEERKRVKHEMDLFTERNMIPVLRSLIYMISVFREKKIVWGIGRGSSVASFVLYLIGVHKIHSIRFGLQIEDFLR